ncbi:hypothetical protein L873DRAFT_1819213, partial [Choiromyces venosus 120613-1]
LFPSRSLLFLSLVLVLGVLGCPLRLCLVVPPALLVLGFPSSSLLAPENSQVPHKAAPVTCPNPENNLTKKQKSRQLSPSYNRGSTTQL